MGFDSVDVVIDHDADEGWLFISPDARPSKILAALEQVDEAGFEELDSFETGDDPEFDEHGRMMIPLVRRYH